MSSTRDRGKVVFECDHCHETLETETSNFADAVETLKTTDKWLIDNRRGVWLHFCTPRCQTDWIKAKEKRK